MCPQSMQTAWTYYLWNECTSEFCKGRCLTGLLCLLFRFVAFWKPVFKMNFLIPTLVYVKNLSIIRCLPKNSTNSLTWQRSNFPTLFSTKTPMKTSWSVFCSAHSLSLSVPLLRYLTQLPHTIFALENLTLSYLTKPHPSLRPNSSPTSFWK